MLQVNFIKQNKDYVLKRLSVKNFGDKELIDKIITHDEERKKLQFNLDETQSKINVASKQIGQLMAGGGKTSAEEKKMEVASLKLLLHAFNEKLSAVEKQLLQDVVKLPNIPHVSVPPGKTPEENEVV